MEFEISQFRAPGIPRGQANYYGTTFLYTLARVLSCGMPSAPFNFPGGQPQDSEEYWLGGNTTLHYQYTDEPNDWLIQMATNLGYDNGQTFCSDAGFITRLLLMECMMKILRMAYWPA